MGHRLAPYIAGFAAFVAASPAAARPLTIRQPASPQLTLQVPRGWHAHVQRRIALLTRGKRRLGLLQCPLLRAERDMTGRHAARGAQHDSDLITVPVPGGSCLTVSGPGAPAFAKRLHPVLGPGGPAPKSDAAAEQLARAARARTLGQARATGTGAAVPFGLTHFVEATFEWDLVNRYAHQVQRYGSATEEVVYNRDGEFLRQAEPCWGETSPPREDDAFEPRLELSEWNAPPAIKTAWRVAYAPAEPQPDGSTRIAWTGFVADGTAVVGADGLLRSVTIDDHHMAIGRSGWRTVAIAFTGFPAAITPVSATPRCD